MIKQLQIITDAASNFNFYLSKWYEIWDRNHKTSGWPPVKLNDERKNFDILDLLFLCEHFFVQIPDIG